MTYMFLDSRQGLRIVGLVQKDRLREIYIDSDLKPSNIASIYRGRVESVIKGMNSAFIDIGSENNAYLNLKDALPRDKMYDRPSDYSITDFLDQGQELIVQVKKEGSETKGPKVTTHLELGGRNIILLAYSDRVNISRKIRDRDQVARLRSLAQEIKLKDYGMIIRTSSQSVSNEELRDEYRELVGIYEKIDRERNFLPTPKLLHKPLLDWENLLVRKYANLEEIIVNGEKDFKELENLLVDQGLDPGKLRLDKDYRLDYDERVYPDLTRGLERKVNLRSGGSIVIDELEALTAIDVNTESSLGNRSFRKNVLRTNREAAREIAYQIRLRNISGIILIDFINMEDDHRELVRESLEEELRKDSIASTVYGYTRLGLLELSRTKKRRSLKEEYNILDLDKIHL